MLPKKQSVPVTYIRGGTSKALFFHEKDVPPPGPGRDRFLLRVMGSPDPMQIDGMGGSHIVTSKIAIIGPSSRPDADVDYTFCQISIDTPYVGYTGNCGNISSGVGPFAIDEGLVKEDRPGFSVDPKLKTREVRIYNTGTKKILLSHVPVDQETGFALEAGNFEIAGCPGSAAPILMDFKNVVGATLGGDALPTEKSIDQTTIGDKSIAFTICDVGNMCVFASAHDFGITGAETPKEIDSNKTLIAQVKELRGKAAQLVGMCKSWQNVDDESPMIPMVVLVSQPTVAGAHLQSRLFLDNRCHTAMAGTGAICTAACSRILGSVVQSYPTGDTMKQDTYQIQHPSGILPVIVQATPLQDSLVPKFKTLSFVRTSRRIFDGRLYVPNEIKSDVFPENLSKDHTSGLSNGNGTQHSKPNGNSNTAALENTSKSETSAIVDFIVQTKFQDLTTKHTAALKMFILDFVGLNAGATSHSPSSGPFLKAIQNFGNSIVGKSTVIAQKQTLGPAYAALLNAAGAHSLDFDDTHARGALHPGVSVISAALAEVEAAQIQSPEALFTALAVGYEVCCRIGMALGPGGHAMGFHNTSTAGIFGAVATIAKLRDSPRSVVESSFGLALSKASGTNQYLTNGSWNKRLHPGFAAHDAFMCIALAEAGTVGAAEPIEGKFGLVKLFSSTPNLSPLQQPFGTEWVFLETAIKPYPACRMTHAAIELASQISEQNKDRNVKRIAIKCPKRFYQIVGEPNKRKLQPENVVDAQFSIYFQTAIAWIYGLSIGQAAYDHLKDPKVLELIQKMTVVADDTHNGFHTSLFIEWEDGNLTKQELQAPSGEPGNPISWDTVHKKFLGLAGPVYGEVKAEKISDTILHFEKYTIKDLTDLYG